MTNTDTLSRAGLPIMYTLLIERRLCWLGHVYRMEDGRIPKDILYGELAAGQRGLGRPQLRYKDVCKRDMKAVCININSWEDLTADRTSWRSTLQNSCRLVRKSCQRRQQRSEPTERKHQRTERSQHTYATYVVVTVTLALVSTVTKGAAQAEQTVWIFRVR